MPNLSRYEDTLEMIKRLFKFLTNSFVFERKIQNKGKTKENKFIVQMFKIASRSAILIASIYLSVKYKNNTYIVYIVIERKEVVTTTILRIQILLSDSFRLLFKRQVRYTIGLFVSLKGKFDSNRSHNYRSRSINKRLTLISIE